MRILLIIGLAVLSLNPNSLQAITIDQAVNDALQHNPQIQQFFELENAAASRSDQAEAPFWPQIEANYSYWRGDRDPSLDSQELSLAETSASYNLFNGGSDWFSLQEAKHLASAANYKYQSIVADVILEVKRAYIGVLRTERTVETESKSVELLEKQRNETKLRLDQGLLARNDLLRVDVEMATAQQILETAKGRFEIARKTLARTLGRPLDEQETLSDLTMEPAEPKPEEELSHEMFAKRSELKFLYSLLEAQKAGKKAVRGDLLPEVDLVLSYDRFGNHALPQTSDPDYDSESRAILQASWTLFSGFDTRHELVGREHEIRARQKEVKATEDELTLQLQTALEAFRVSERNLTTAETAELQAEENYRVNDNRYRANIATTVDLLDAQEFLTRARNERVKALYDLHLSAVVIERVLERGPTLSEKRGGERGRP
ncbi:MAG: TolC family protein [Desulfuromonadales bacterium]|jgi:outer membrane protein TolC|nr:TolC family protein [Desulfuromonadales bacterium]